MNRRSLILALLLSLVWAVPVWARTSDFIEVYTYNAGENDSKLTCRTVSLIEVKRLLLEKIGTYLETRTEVKNFEITSDDIIALTGGIVKTEILKEEWNGDSYRLTARIEADPDDIAKKIDELRKTTGSVDSARRLAEVNVASLEQLREMQSEMTRLQSNLVKVNQDLNANQGLLNAWGLYEKGVNLRQTGNPQEAVGVMTQALAENPTAMGFFERGMAYMELQMPEKAIADFTAALAIEPNMRGAMFKRGQVYLKQGQKSEAVSDFKRAAELGHPHARKWLKKNRYSF
ncbi:MAG: tetratricopeptide repeat protein [Pseudomonadota bacterium]